MTDGGWDGRLTLSWGGEDRDFNLRIGELIRIEQESGAGIVNVMERLAGRKATLSEVRSILRYGLEGGGMKPAEVGVLMTRYFDLAGAWAEQYAIASRILEAALFMPRQLAEKRPGKAEGGGQTTAGSPSP